MNLYEIRYKCFDFEGLPEYKFKIYSDNANKAVEGFFGLFPEDDLLLIDLNEYVLSTSGKVLAMYVHVPAYRSFIGRLRSMLASKRDG